MVKEIKIRYIGEDDWNREVYENIESGRIYKRYKGDKGLYSSSSFNGEPENPLRDDLIVTIVN